MEKVHAFSLKIRFYGKRPKSSMPKVEVSNKKITFFRRKKHFLTPLKPDFIQRKNLKSSFFPNLKTHSINHRGLVKKPAKISIRSSEASASRLLRVFEWFSIVFGVKISQY
jgi:hypothetical protein